MSTIPLFISGSSHPQLASEIAMSLKIQEGKRFFHLFPDKEIFVEIQEPVLGREVFVFQSLGENPNYHLMELFILLDALRRAAAASVTVVIPYYAYARQDRQSKMGVPITAKLIANLLRESGTDYLITMDLHSEQIEGFFDIPVQQLISRDLFIRYCQSLQLENVVVVAPDKGGIKIAAAYAKELEVPFALIDKERIDSYQVEMRLFVGDVKGKTVILPDDMCSTGGTLVKAAEICADLGANRIIATVAHGLFINEAIERIEKSPIELVITTNSIPQLNRENISSKFRVLSISSLISQAIEMRIVSNRNCL